MAAFLYRCPQTGQMVQGWRAENPTGNATYEPVQPLACRAIDLINRKTGKVANHEDN